MNNGIIEKEKVIFLIDMDSFFASCHMAQDPSLKTKNVVVATSNKRAIISTASYNARRFGIKAGMPVFKAKEICPDLTIVDSNFSLYVMYSQLIFDFIYQNYSSIMEVASIDECYVDVTNCWKKYGSVTKMAEDLMNAVEEKFGLTCSVGISTNKFLAKMAVDFHKPKGATVLLPKDIQKILWPLPVKDMFGIGAASEKILVANNINTIGDIANTDFNKLGTLFGKRGYSLFLNANGRGDDRVNSEDNELKSIGNEFTLDNPAYDVDEILGYITELSLKIASKARKRYLKGKNVSVVIKYRRPVGEEYNKDVHKKHITHQTTLSEHTNDPEIIMSAAKQLFLDIYDGRGLALLGVRLSKLKTSIHEYKQISLKDYDDVTLDWGSNETSNLIDIFNWNMNKKLFYTADDLEKMQSKNMSQSKYLRYDIPHISNAEIKEKWSKKKGE